MRRPKWSGGLALVSEEEVLVARDLEQIAERIRRRNPGWRVGAVRLRELELAVGKCGWAGPRVMVNLHPLPERVTTVAGKWGAKVYCGKGMAKSEEMAALERRGLPVPRWRVLKQGETVSEAEFGRYVVVKPDEGLRGACVRIVKTSKVTGAPMYVEFTGRDSAPLVQEFIYTGPRPVSHRVGVLFGKAIYRWRVEGRAVEGRELPPDGDFRKLSGTSVVSTGKECRFTDELDEEVVALAEKAAAALPDIPLLGVDIVRRAGDWRLFILELNASGYCFHITSDLGRKIQQSMGLDFAAQYGGYEYVAELYARHHERVVAEAEEAKKRRG